MSHLGNANYVKSEHYKYPTLLEFLGLVALMWIGIFICAGAYEIGLSKYDRINQEIIGR